MKEKNNGVHQSCASCKHQRKKCIEGCPLAPFFPWTKNKEFQSVHKLFGVSNVLKHLNVRKSFEEKRKVAETFIWEAEWREREPVEGCYAAYSRVLQDNDMLRKACKEEVVQRQQLQKMVQQLMRYNPGFLDWNNINGNGAGGVHYNAGCYPNVNGNLALQSIPYNYANYATSQVQIPQLQVEGQEKGSQALEATPLSSVFQPSPVDCFNPPFFPSDMYGMNVEINKTLRNEGT